GKPSCDTISARNGRKAAGHRRVRALFHVRPPPGAIPGSRRRERHPSDSSMTLLETACDTVTAV
ncbi:MAG TPA: hypothetical protein VD863_17230, partial [Bradyrhizobium sp.]|nr:hypothetical protein [Bradyrhizobium sp.]